MQTASSALETADESSHICVSERNQFEGDSPLDRGEGVCPVVTPTYMGVTGQVDKWTAWRISTDRRSDIQSIFMKYCSVVAEEFSKKGVQHYHCITIGPRSLALAKSIQRLKLERHQIWSKEFPNNEDKYKDYTFEKAISYTVKGGNYKCYKSFIRYMTDDIPSWVFPSDKEISTRDMTEKEIRNDRHWQLTFSNLVVQALRHRKQFGLQTTSLEQVVRHMARHTKWRPSKEMRKSGVHPSYDREFEWECNNRPGEYNTDWWRMKIGDVF